MLALLVKVPFPKPVRKFPVKVERGMKRHLLPELLIAGATLGGLHQMLLMQCWRPGGSPSVSQTGSFLGSAGLLLHSLQPEIASLRPLACSATFPPVPSSQNCCSPLLSVSPVCFKDINPSGAKGPAYASTTNPFFLIRSCSRTGAVRL